MTSLNDLKPVIRLSIAGTDEHDGSVFGRGVAALCQGVRDYGSLNAAAKEMHMAYSKAWRIVKSTETELGITLLDRDGAHGSTLTPEGEMLLDAYNAVSEHMQEAAEKAYIEYLNPPALTRPAE